MWVGYKNGPPSSLPQTFRQSSGPQELVVLKPVKDNCSTKHAVLLQGAKALLVIVDEKNPEYR
jgi:hypothetical protein